jgi:putative sporulation protein YtaF
VLQYLSLLALAFAVSLDGFGVGISYGLRRIKIPFLSILIITSCSASVILFSMLLGNWVSSYINLKYANLFGAWILIGVGAWAIFNLKQNKETEQPDSDMSAKNVEPQPVLNIEIKKLGLVIHILKTPTVADMDKSGTITGGEATLLGMALSLDAFGAGIGAALMGYSPILTAFMVSVLSTCFILLGLRLGFVYSNIQWLKRISFIPGVILIIFGISRIL